MSEPILELTGLTKVYPGGLRALDNVDLTINKGEIFALLGPNGAGKTTLISQLMGAQAPDSGRILFKGRDITATPAHRRAALGITRSFQITSLIMESLTEPWMDETYLASLFRTLGEPPVRCRVARDWGDGSRPSKGYGVVQLGTRSAARKLLKAFGEGGLPALHPYRFLVYPAKTPCSVFVGKLEMAWCTPALLRYIFDDEQVCHSLTYLLTCCLLLTSDDYFL